MVVTAMNVPNATTGDADMRSSSLTYYSETNHFFALADNTRLVCSVFKPDRKRCVSRQMMCTACSETQLTTSVFVILASSSVRLSPHCDWLAKSSWRPQIAAPTLPVAIMDGGCMANLKSVGGEENTN